MAQIKIKLEDNECMCDVKDRLCKALSDDSILIGEEHYQDELMEDLVDEIEEYYSKQYLKMVKEIVFVLTNDL